MDKTLNNLFYYLEKEKITIDKKEFEFQLQSHPDYPSFLSFSDTLHFFDIKNIVIKIDFNQLTDMPVRFMLLLDEVKGEDAILELIEKKEGKIKVSKNNKDTSESEIKSRWKNIVLIVEKAKLEDDIKLVKTNNMLISILLALLFIIVLFQRSKNIFSLLLFILPSLGIFFSIAALKDLFETKSNFINNFCNITASSDCSSVIESNKWKLFKYIKFSDLSFIFFTSQSLTLLLSIYLNEIILFLSFQKIILYLSVPILFISVYYQKYIAKKWCPICLTIALILLLECLTLLFIPFSLNKIENQITLFGFVFFSIYLSWNGLRSILERKKELNHNVIKSLRFERNYKMFKNVLISKEKTNLPDCSIVLGNKQSKTGITIISNPFCGHCKNVHIALDKILERSNDFVYVNIILRTDFSFLDDDSKKLFRSLVFIYQNKDQKQFTLALRDWFKYQNVKEWLNKYSIDIELTYLDKIFENHYEWTNKAGYNFTPAIFINGYEYPNIYDRKNLEFFINEIIEDTDFN